MRILKAQMLLPLDCKIGALVCCAVSGMGARGQRVDGRTQRWRASHRFHYNRLQETKGARGSASP